MTAAVKQERAFDVVCATTDRDAWLDNRSDLLTASDVSAVLGLNPYKSPLELWMEKTGNAPGQVQTEPMEMGLRMEPVILDLYRDRTGRVAKPFQRLCVSRTAPWLGATCDAWTLIDGEDAPVELKNASVYVGEDWAEGVAEYYLPQVMTQMLVMGSRRASVGCLIGGNRFVWADVEWDQALADRILSEGAAFMETIKNGAPPAPDGSESSARALAARFPKEEPGKVIALDQRAVELDALIRSCQDGAKAFEASAELARQELKTLIGDAHKGVLPGGGGWQWSTVERKEHMVKASTSRVFRRVK